MSATFHITTLGCPKNAVDSDKVTATLLADGLSPADSAEQADLVVVNTCAFIEAARTESIEVALELAEAKKPGARLVVTGCMAERYGDELAHALPEADAVIGFENEGSIAPVTFKTKPAGVRDLLELPRPKPQNPWAYLKVAEGCDRACAFCAIPSFRGKQRSRLAESIETEARQLVEMGTVELVLVAQDLAWYGRDIGEKDALAKLLRRIDQLKSLGLGRMRLLYLYPSEVKDPLVETMLETETVVPYFDLSLQHASAPLLRTMKRWGSGEKFLEMIDSIRQQEPAAVFRSSFIVGFPGETEDDQDELHGFLEAAQLDWAGFFPHSKEVDTPAAALEQRLTQDEMMARHRELDALQTEITAAKRAELVGTQTEVLIDGEEDGELVGRTYREAPEIDGVVKLPDAFAKPGALVKVTVAEAAGTDLVGIPIGAA